MNNEHIKWSDIAKITGILGFVVGAVYWGATLQSDVKYLVQSMEELKPLVQRHDTDIKVIQTQLSSKEK